MTPPRIPDIPGLAKLTAKEMNDIHFAGHHSPSTPKAPAGPVPSTRTATPAIDLQIKI